MFIQKNTLLSAGASLLDSLEAGGRSSFSFPIAKHLPAQSEKLDVQELTSLVLKSKTTGGGLSLARTMEPTSAALMGDWMDMASGSANFDWNANPAAADGEVIACEMVRKACGLDAAYALAQGGLELFLPHLNEALLLCFHSTTYHRGTEAASKLVVYGVNDSVRMKPFQFRNCAHVRPTPFVDEFQTVPDLARLRKTILEDKSKGLVPHFLICSITELNSILRLAEIYKMLASEFGMSLFVDLSPLGLQVLMGGAASSIDADFVFVDVSEASHLSSGVLYLKDKGTYEKNLINPPQEYLKQAVTSTKEETRKKFDAYDFTIGFSNYVSWQKFLFFAISKGKNGIKQALERQKANLELICTIASKSGILEGIKVQENHVVARLQTDPSVIAKAYQKDKILLPFEIVDKNTNNLVRFYAPMMSTLDRESVETLFGRLKAVILT